MYKYWDVNRFCCDCRRPQGGQLVVARSARGSGRHTRRVARAPLAVRPHAATHVSYCFNLRTSASNNP